MQDLSYYRLSQKTGAVLEMPAETLPTKYEPWIRLLQELPDLYAKQLVRQFVHELPLIQLDDSLQYPELRLAHKALAFATSAYVWQDGEDGVPSLLPAQIAVPFVALSQRLGMEPILTHQDLVLGNCLYTGDELLPKAIHQLSGHTSWKPFIEIHGLIEITFAPCFKFIMDALDAQHPLVMKRITTSLDQISDVLSKLSELLKMLHTLIDPNEFYVELRKLLCGWNTSSLKDGLIYQGVHEMERSGTGERDASHYEMISFHNFKDVQNESVKLKCIGPSAAQSICLQTMDEFLQIERNPTDTNFFHLMRQYMTKEHREFLMDLSRQSRIRHIVWNSASDEMKNAFDKCILKLRHFRCSHIELVRKFIIEPSTVSASAINELKTRGTGGQKIEAFLRRVHEETK